MNAFFGFAACQTRQAISVSTLSEQFTGSNETFSVTFHTPTNATLAAATGTGTFVEQKPDCPQISSISSRFRAWTRRL
jgi:hypothetical protein